MIIVLFDKTIGIVTIIAVINHYIGKYSNRNGYLNYLARFDVIVIIHKYLSCR